MGVLDDRELGRRRAFGDYLRSRRGRLTPADVDLPAGFRRRTHGLRREEVALLAGIGVTWYTWLEQGRDVQASPELLSALARALRLAPAEKRHLFELAGRAAPMAVSNGPEQVSEALRRMLDSLAHQPAYVMGRRWDVLAWNRPAVALFGDYGARRGDERNIMHMLFADPAHRRLLLDWRELAPRSLAVFRADSARYAGDPDFERLIDVLSHKSPEFGTWWATHDVLPPLAGHKRIRHPKLGDLAFEYTSFSVQGDDDLKLVVYTPVTADDARALTSLCESAVPNAALI